MINRLVVVVGLALAGSGMAWAGDSVPAVAPNAALPEKPFRALGTGTPFSLGGAAADARVVLLANDDHQIALVDPDAVSSGRGQADWRLIYAYAANDKTPNAVSVQLIETDCSQAGRIRRRASALLGVNDGTVQVPEISAHVNAAWGQANEGLGGRVWEQACTAHAPGQAVDTVGTAAGLDPVLAVRLWADSTGAWTTPPAPDNASTDARTTPASTANPPPAASIP